MKKFITVHITASDETNAGVFVTKSVNGKGAKALTLAKAPSISGTSKVGQKLTLGKLSWGATKPTKITYQWYRCSTAVQTGAAISTGCKAVSGAKSSSYKLTKTDKSKYLALKLNAVSGSLKVSQTIGVKSAIK